MLTRLNHFLLALAMAPGLLASKRKRHLWREMRIFARQLPVALRLPLPQAQMALTPALASLAQAGVKHSDIRRLADLVALLDRRSPLGLCLRRSLIRYHFLRQAGLPVIVNFGARLLGGQPERQLTGHAWVTVAGAPYFEASENWRDFKIMLTWPESL